MTRDAPDAVVVGSGPNGLAAAITLAQAGRSVVVYEGAETIGGGMRSAELTLPGIVHDVCSTIQGTSLASPFFRALDLPSLGVELLHPEAPLAHPLDDGRVAILERSVAPTAAGLGVDADRYRHLMAPLVRDADKLMPFVLGPFNPFPRHPLAAARFGFPALRSARGLAGSFHDELASALMTGLSGHAMVPLGQLLTSAFGLVLGISAHAYGWPVVRGGTQVMADAMAAKLRALGGEIANGRPIASSTSCPLPGDPLRPRHARWSRSPARAPRPLPTPPGGLRYGAGIFKVDWALDGPIPWRAGRSGAPGPCTSVARWQEIAAAEAEVTDGRHPSAPSSSSSRSRGPTRRAPRRQETAGPTATCRTAPPRHERAHRGPGRALRARLPRPHPRPGRAQPGRPRARQPELRRRRHQRRHAGPAPAVHAPRRAARSLRHAGRALFICSSSTPPGGGVHGMCGVFGARSALRREFGAPSLRSGVTGTSARPAAVSRSWGCPSRRSG